MRPTVLIGCALLAAAVYAMLADAYVPVTILFGVAGVALIALGRAARVHRKVHRKKGGKR